MRLLKRPLIAGTLAGVLIVAAGISLHLLHRRNRIDHRLSGGLSDGAVLELDLGLTQAGGGIIGPTLTPTPGLREVRLSLLVPVSPGALYEIEVRDPADAPLLRTERGPLLLDDLGGARVSLAAFHFAKSGNYRLVLREFAPDGGVREYRYPFRVRLPPSG